ncbi:MAG TPA: hypothetical protein VFH61_09030 [Thermoleophilia bacterium]|nr:hypothetical protein [Thermoleophilia bacterium]
METVRGDVLIVEVVLPREAAPALDDAEGESVAVIEKRNHRGEVTCPRPADDMRLV